MRASGVKGVTVADVNSVVREKTVYFGHYEIADSIPGV